MSTLKEAEDIAGSAGDGGPAGEMKQTQAAPDKMENSLEMSKSNKQSIDSATDVAGREGKGTGLVDKLVPDKPQGKDSSADASLGGRNY